MGGLTGVRCFSSCPRLCRGDSDARSACVGCWSHQHSAWEGCLGSQPNDPFIGILPGALGASKGCGRKSRQVPIILHSAQLHDGHCDVLTHPNEKNHLALRKQSMDLRSQGFAQALTCQGHWPLKLPRTPEQPLLPLVCTPMTFTLLGFLGRSLSKSAPLDSLGLARLFESWEWRPKVGHGVGTSPLGSGRVIPGQRCCPAKAGLRALPPPIFFSQIKSALVMFQEASGGQPSRRHSHGLWLVGERGETVRGSDRQRHGERD